jgi:methylated-DNA-protein-cysteine methyltransferase-like protein
MSFFVDVYKIVKKIPPGKVTTYGEIARALGTRDARKVGWAMHANRDPGVPCHRVVDRTGRLAPNFAFDGAEEQRRRLAEEGVTFKKDEMHVNLNTHLFTFSDER